MTDLNTTWFNLSHLHFIRPWWLLALMPLFVFFFILRREGDLTQQWRKYMSPEMVKQLTINGQTKSSFTPKNLFLVFGVASTLVMAGPTWTKQASPLFKDNSELIIVLDVADTMNQTDLQPTRLTRAKQKITQLLDRRGDAKTALVVYGGSAHVAMPITKDRTLARYFLDVLDEQLLPSQETSYDTFIEPVTELLANAKASSTVLLVTDKTSTQTISRLDKELSKLEHQVVVWAIGEHPDSGSDSPTSSIGLTQKSLYELTQLAESGKGEMVAFTHDSRDINEIYTLIQSSLFGSNDSNQPWLDSGYWLLFLLLPMQLLWFRKGWTLKW